MDNPFPTRVEVRAGYRGFTIAWRQEACEAFLETMMSKAQAEYAAHAINNYSKAMARCDTLVSEIKYAIETEGHCPRCRRIKPSVNGHEGCCPLAALLREEKP
jgi:Zn finger protein HypA/HybF involved in hydrogenase expression